MPKFLVKIIEEIMIENHITINAETEDEALSKCLNGNYNLKDKVVNHKVHCYNYWENDGAGDSYKITKIGE